MLRKRWDKEYLNQYCLDNEIKIDHIQDNIKINRDTPITGQCTNYSTCRQHFEKKFRYILENGGAFCKLCTEKNTKSKTVKTNIVKYGAPCSLLNPSIIEKCKKTNILKYGSENAASSEIVRLKMQKTNIKKRGVLYPAQSPEVQEKMRKTTLERLGVTHNSQSEEIKTKKENTNLKNRGVKNPLLDPKVLEKISKTVLERFGVTHISQSEEIKIKKENTNLKNRGVKHPLQDPKVSSKSLKGSYKTKEYISTSGNILYYQGYENFALDEVFKTYKEDDIVTGKENVPEIWYTNISGKESRYFTDISIRKEKKCIEVKSPWTFKQDKNILLKQKAAKDSGFECEIWVYNGKGNKLECHL